MLVNISTLTRQKEDVSILREFKWQSIPRSLASKLPQFKTGWGETLVLKVLSVKMDETSEGAQDFLDTGLLSVSSVTSCRAFNWSTMFSFYHGQNERPPLKCN